MNKRTTVIPALSLVIIILISYLFTTHAQNQPKAWYVYKYATGLNNGTSWDNAWTSFSSVNWNAMANGDTLYISGGTDSTIYNERLNILNSNINVLRSNFNGHNGIPIIYGEGIKVNSKSNILINGIAIFATVDEGIEIDFSNNIIIDKVYIVTDARGIFIQNSSDIIIRNSVIKTTEFSLKQTDGIYSQRNRRVNIHNNFIEIKNSEPNGHNDCIQIIKDGISSNNSSENTMMVWNNILFQNNTKLSNSSATMMTYGWGWFTFYNNLIIQPYSYTVGIGVQQNIELGLSNMKCRVWNNTLIAGTNHDKPIYFRRMSVNDTIDVVNNVIFNSYQYQKVKIDDSENLNIKRWNYNGYFSSHPNWQRLLILNQSPINIDGWISSGYDLNSKFVDPNFTAPYIGLDSIGNFSPGNNSPLINQGLNISQEVLELGLPWEDILGNQRGAAPTIGAFEFSNNQNISDTLSPEVVSANILDSITVNLVFSEPIEHSSATNPDNYSIDNGILVNSVQLLGSLSVKLNTTVHTPGFYTVTVINVTDTAGNVISPQHSSALYGYNPDPLPGLLKFTPTRSNASSVPEPEHIPDKTFDGLGYNSGDPTSRWAASGLPQWIDYDLGDAKMLNKTRIQFYNWNQGRIYNYSIKASTDSVNWNPVKLNILSTNTEWTEEVFEPVPTRYLRIIVHSNNQNNWASLWEAEFYGNLIISGNDDQSNIPAEFRLEQNYPNPFNPSTKIRFVIPASSLNPFSKGEGTLVSLKVYDILGNEVATLVDENKAPGVYEVEFDANNLSSGFYLYRLQANDFIEVKKMMLMR